MKIDVYDNLDALASLQKEWDDLVATTNGEVFLTYDWCRVWWQHYGKKREVKVLVFREQDRIVGVVPLFKGHLNLGLSNFTYWRIVGAEHTFAATRLPVIPRVLHEVIEACLRILRNSCDVVHFGPLAGRYEAFPALLAACQSVCTAGRQKEWTVISRESGEQTYFEMAHDWEAQLGSLSHEQRRAMRRKYERILQSGKTIECVAATEETFRHVFSEFVDCHQSNWERQGKPGHFRAWPGSRSFHEEMAAAQLRHGRLRLYELRVDHKVIGYNYGYKFGDTYYYLLFGRKLVENEDKTDFVRIDFAEMVKRATGEGVKWFDTMRGRYEYKLHLGGKLFPIRDLFLVSHRPKSRARMFSVRLLAKSLRIGYARGWRSWLAPRAGITAQAFWDKWLECEDFAF